MRSLGGVELVNVQFAGAPHHVDGARTLAVVNRDSRAVTGRAGPSKPLVPDIFDALAADAARLSIPLFAFSNADIRISQAAVDFMAAAGASVFFREDEDTAGASRGILLTGADLFAVPTAWWRGNRRRFRPYILGEPGWDNCYTAVLACHAGAVLENRRGLVRHTMHDTAWTASPFARYTQLQLARDAGYFHLWCTYYDALGAMRMRGASEGEERQLAARVFVWRPTLRQRVVQAGRNVKAWMRYRLLPDSAT